MKHNQSIVVAHPGAPERVNDYQRTYELKQLRYEDPMKCQSLITCPTKISENDAKNKFEK